MSNRSSCAVLLLAITLVVAPGVSRSPAGAQGPERDPFAEEPSAEVKPEKPKVEDPFGPSASKADAQAGPTTAEVRAPAKARPKRRKGKAAATPKLPLRYGEKAVIEALAEPTEMEFIETPLDDVLAHLQNKHRIHVRRDRKALDDVGIGTDTPITISLSGVPLDVALKTMLRDLDLTFTVRDGMLLVTTLEEEETTLLTRTYDVTDLVLPIGDKRYDSRRLPTVARKTSNDWAQVPYYSMGIGGGTSGKAGAMGGSGGTGGNFFNVMGAPYPGTPYPSANASRTSTASLTPSRPPSRRIPGTKSAGPGRSPPWARRSSLPRGGTCTAGSRRCWKSCGPGSGACPPWRSTPDGCCWTPRGWTACWPTGRASRGASWPTPRCSIT